MKKSLYLFATLAMICGGAVASAQVSESPELATKVKNEGLNNSQITQIAQYMTDLLGSRLTASQQKRRAESLMVDKLKEIGLSNMDRKHERPRERGVRRLRRPEERGS